MQNLILPLFAALLAVLAYRVFIQNDYASSSFRGYRKLGMNSSSNMADEYDSKYTKPAGKSGNADRAKWRVKALFIHPIKSCAAIELSSADVEAAGFTWDRKFALAELLKPQTRLDASEAEKQARWTFRTQRTPGYERLAQVKPEIWLREKAAGEVSNGHPDSGFLLVKYPSTPSGAFAPLSRFLLSVGLLPPETSFRVPLVPPPNHSYPSEQVTIWRDSPTWLNYGIHVPKSLGVFLGAKSPLSLFRSDPGSYREVYRCAPRREQLGYQPVVGFADAYPVHLLNLASVHDVGDKINGAIPRFSARRFRANILLAGPSAYNEDDWKKVKIGEHLFHCACHTVRCRLPNVDPDTAERHPVEPDKILKSFRCIDDGDPLNACLGLQLVPAQSSTFQLRVGDEVEVLERGEHHYIKQ